jgi:hypothetical protein
LNIVHLPKGFLRSIEDSAENTTFGAENTTFGAENTTFGAEKTTFGAKEAASASRSI